MNIHRLKYRLYQDNKWYEGYPIVRKSGEVNFVIPGDSGESTDTWLYNIDSKNLCQYTAMKDLYGKPIYQGDIIEIRDEEDFLDLEDGKMISKVDFDEYFSVECPSGEYDYIALRNIIDETIGEMTVVVIGNVFENKDLLK